MNITLFFASSLKSWRFFLRQCSVLPRAKFQFPFYLPSKKQLHCLCQRVESWISVILFLIFPNLFATSVPNQKLRQLLTKSTLSRKILSRKSDENFSQWTFSLEEYYQILEVSGKKWQNFIIFPLWILNLKPKFCGERQVEGTIISAWLLNIFLSLKLAFNLQRGVKIEHLQHYIVLVVGKTFRLKKVTKFWLCDKNFPRRNFPR